MPKFYKFKTAAIPMEELLGKEDEIDYESLGIPRPKRAAIQIEYRSLPIRLSSIIYYYPLKPIDSAAADEIEIINDDLLWDTSTFINAVLVDGTELIINHEIKEFEKLLEEN